MAKRYRKMTAKEFTKAANRYARKYGHYVHTVRTNTTLRQAAISDYSRALGIVCVGLTAPAYRC